MIKQSIDVLALQETHIAQNNKERREKFTWYTNDNEDSKREFAGMAFVINNEHNKQIEDLKPHTSRIVELILRSSAPLTIVNVYAPQSGRPEEEKEQFYQQLKEVLSKTNKKGPILIIGDFNARLQEPEDEEEEEWIGEHTYAKGQPTTWQQSDEMANK